MDFFDTVSASENGAFVHLTNMRTQASAYVTGKDGKEDETKPIRIKVLGPDSAEFRTKARKRAGKMIKQRAGKMDFGKMTEAQVLSVITDGEDSKLHDAIDATVGWENINLDGKPAEFSAENVEKLYRKYPAITAEVNEFIENRANFFD